MHIPFIAIAETVFTLQSYYEIDRADIGRELLKLLTAPGVTLTRPAWILEPVDHFQTRKVSFGDACIAAEAGAALITFAPCDRGLDKVPRLKRYEPRT